MSTLLNKSAREDTVKYFSRMFSKLAHSTNMCFTVSGIPQDWQVGESSPLNKYKWVRREWPIHSNDEAVNGSKALLTPWRVSIVRLSLPSASAALARLSADASSSSARMYNTSCSIRRWPSPMNTVEPASVATATDAAAGAHDMASSTKTDSASGELRDWAIWMMDALKSRTNSNFSRSSLCSRWPYTTSPDQLSVRENSTTIKTTRLLVMEVGVAGWAWSTHA